MSISSLALVFGCGVVLRSPHGIKGDLADSGKQIRVRCLLTLHCVVLNCLILHA